MGIPTGRGVMAGRGIAAAAVATFAVTVSHGAAAGAPPSAWSVLVAFVAAAVLCVALAGRRLSWVRLTAAVGASQLFFHFLLSIDFGATAATRSASAHVHHGALPAAAESVMPAALQTASSPGMWIAHAVAALVTIGVIGAGEQTLAALVRLIRSPFRALRPLQPLAGPAPRVPAPAAAPVVARAIILSAVRRRGPPVLG